MRITVLGCWAPYPAAGGACSGYLVETENTRILLEIGHGVFGKLQEATDFRQLDLAIVSHFHPDHWGDASCLRHAVCGALREGTRENKLPVYVPREPEEEYSRALKMTDGLAITAIEDVPAGGIPIPGGVISFFPANHPLKAFGVVIEHDGKKIIFSGDTGESVRLVEAALNCDLLICETSLLEQDKAYGLKRGHLTAGQAARAAREAGARRLILTHLWPEYELAVLHNEATAVFPGAILAREQLVLEL